MGARPDRLLKKVEGEEYRARLQEDRKSFLLYVKGEVFLRAALVRVKGEVAGYLTESTGIIEHTDERGCFIHQTICPRFAHSKVRTGGEK